MEKKILPINETAMKEVAKIIVRARLRHEKNKSRDRLKRAGG